MGTVLSWVTPEIPEEEPRLEIPHEERVEEMVLHALSIQLGVTDGRQEKGEFQVIRLLCHALAVVGDFEFYEDMVRQSQSGGKEAMTLGGDEYFNPRPSEGMCQKWRHALIQPRCTQDWVDDIE
jgi:hypothetical protein